MTRRIKAISALLTACALTASLFAGCGGGGPSSAESSAPATSSAPASAASPASSGSAGAAPAEEGTAEGTLFEETFSFTIMSPVWEPHSTATEDMEIFNEIAKRTNTKIDYQWFPTDGYKDRVTTTLASGSIPEVIESRDSLEMLIEQGAAVALDDALEQFGPNILAAIGDVSASLRTPSDGRLYALPFVLDYPPAYSMLVRRDWLTAVGIEKVPETWEEWLAAWTAFKEGDPNGDGDKTNDIPYGGDIFGLLPAFGMDTAASRYAFVVDGAGNYTLAYECPEFRDYLEAMRGLYAKGILDAEFTTRGTYVNQKELEKALFSGIIGSTMTWAEIAKRTTEAVRDVKPDAEMIGVKPVAGPGGKSGVPARAKASNTAVLTVSAEQSGKVEGIIRYYNWLFGEEGTLLSSFGIEGRHYTMADGKPKISAPYCESFVNARGAGLNFTPLPHLFDADAYEQILLAGKDYESCDDSTKIFYDALHSVDGFQYDAPVVLATEAYQEKGATVMPKLESLLAECVTGKLTVDGFYAEYEKLRPIGLQDILDQGKDAWAKMN